MASLTGVRQSFSRRLCAGSRGEELVALHHVAVEPFRLDRYIDEQVFRYNNRATKDRFVGDGDRFQMAMRHITGRRITYEQLTGKGTDAVHQA